MERQPSSADSFEAADFGVETTWPNHRFGALVPADEAERRAQASAWNLSMASTASCWHVACGTGVLAEVDAGVSLRTPS